MSYKAKVVWDFAWVDSVLVILDKSFFYKGGSLNRFDCNGFKLLNIFAKVSILDVWQGSEYASANTFKVKRAFIKRSTILSFFLPEAHWCPSISSYIWVTTLWAEWKLLYLSDRIMNGMKIATYELPPNTCVPKTTIIWGTVLEIWSETEFFIILGIFSLFITLTTLQIKVWKKHTKRLEILSFYTSVP